MSQSRVDAVENMLRQEYDYAAGGARVNAAVRDMTIKAAAKRVLAGEIASFQKTGNWITVSFAMPNVKDEPRP